MATVITGRDLALTIGGDTFDAQATSAVLSNSPTVDAYQTLAGKVHHHTDDQWTLAVEMLQDWGAVDSLCQALWDAADATPNTPIACTMVSNGVTFAFNVMPVFPPAGGAAPGATTASLSFVVVGKPTN